MRKLGRKCIGIRKNWSGYGQDNAIGGDKKEAQQRPRNEGLGYEGQIRNETINFLKGETLTIDESSPSSSSSNKLGEKSTTINQVQK